VVALGKPEAAKPAPRRGSLHGFGAAGLAW